MANSKDIAVVTATFLKAFVAVGDANETGAKRGELLKRQTESMLEFTNGLDAVVDTVKGIVSEYVRYNVRPVPPAGVKRGDDAECVKYSAAWKRGLNNPLTQVNAAIASAKIAQVIRLSNAGDVTVEATTDKRTDATIKTVEAVLDRFPYSATAAVAIKGALDKWIEAGELALRIASPSAEAVPAIDPELAAAFEQFMAARKATA